MPLNPDAPPFEKPSPSTSDALRSGYEATGVKIAAGAVISALAGFP